MTQIGIAAMTAVVMLAWPEAAHASCIAQTAEQQLARADIVFVGAAVEGPTTTGVQRFRVERYEKGAGADVVRVWTGVVVNPDGTGSITSVSVEAAAGERWRIYGTRGEGDLLNTTVCAGSRPLAGTGSGGAQPPSEPEATSTGRRVAVAGAFVVGLLVLGAALVGRRLRAS